MLKLREQKEKRLQNFAYILECQPSLAVIVLTSNMEPETEQTFLAHGEFAYLSHSCGGNSFAVATQGSKFFKEFSV